MIKTVEDFVRRLMEAGKQRIDAVNVTHPPTIGDMYEGLTKSVLERSIFDGLNLNVLFKIARAKLARRWT